jgi:heptosyltransferase-2
MATAAPAPAREAVLVVGPSWIGDMVMAQSLFLVLAERRPGVAIDVLAPRWSEGLLARMPEVRGGVTMPLGHGELGLATRHRIAARLRERGYAQAIVLPNSLKSALVPWFARIPRRTGWRGEFRYGLLNDLRRLDPARLPRMVERFAALGLDDAAAPIVPPRPRLRADGARGAALREKLGLAGATPVLAICPGAEFGPAKRWPAQHFAAVAAEQIASGWQVWLFGGAGDRAATAAVRAALAPAARERCADLAGRTSLGDAIDLLDACAAVLTNDSGLMHVAAALGKPLVAVYGGSSPDFTPPLCEDAELLVSALDCVPCFARECRYGHYRCLREQAPARAIEALRRVAPGVGARSLRA